MTALVKPTRSKSRSIKKDRVETVLTPRRCLSCSQTFGSESVGNRICRPCRNTDNWRSTPVPYSAAAY
jgi:hypothetical protein